MLSLRLCFILALVVHCVAQPARMEILSRPHDHTHRKGASSLTGVAEFSRDGNFIFFLSCAPNVNTNGPALRDALNLYMTDRRTHETTLISRGLNGEPANDNVVNFEVAADNRSVLFETAASNVVANDTNNATDIFVRDLDFNQTILMSSNTNGVITPHGAAFATMSGDGSKVAFASVDKSYATNSATNSSAAISVGFVRDLASGATEALNVPAPYSLQRLHGISISDDGRWVAFSADVQSRQSLLGGNFITDLETHTTTRIDDGSVAYPSEPLMTHNGTFVAFAQSTNVTNSIVRYSRETGQTELVTSNNVPMPQRPVAISDDGQTILYIEGDGYRVYRDGLEATTFPHTADRTPIALPTTLGMADLSADGRFVTFSTDVPLLATDTSDPAFRTYIYDVAADTLAEIPISARGEPISDPVPNADGSLVVFTALSGIQDPAEPMVSNVYVWDRTSGNIDLSSRAYLGAFENSARGESKLSERFALSDDGNKIVFQSTTPASDIVDTNGAWDVFVLDRSTGRKQLVSVAADGSSSGSAGSIRPIISGDGRVVAFLSRATNLVNVPGKGTEQIYVRELDSGITHLVANTNGLPATYQRQGPDSLSLSRDGRRLAFRCFATDLDKPTLFGFNEIFVYDLTTAKVSLVTYDSTGAFGAGGQYFEPVISPEGECVAFRAFVGSSFGFRNTLAPLVRTLDSRELRQAPSPAFSTGSTALPSRISFNHDGSMLFYGSPPGYFLSWDLTSSNYTILATNCVDAAASDDGAWAAIVRRDSASTTRSQISLRDTVAGSETMIASNALSSVFGNRDSTRIQITSDGHFVVFESRATNLLQNDINGTADIFMFDRDRQRLDLVSKAASGNSGNAASMRPVISPDDTFVAFMSYASDLITHDFNDGSDIFAAYFPAADIDGDGIDDRWEMAQFGSLTHDMDIDSDGDGMSDAAEFAAGTDPLRADSTLRVTDVSGASAHGQTIIVCWAATPGHSYRVQARSKLNESSPWQDVSDAVIASQAESALEVPLPVGASELYFRIVSAD